MSVQRQLLANIKQLIVVSGLMFMITACGGGGGGSANTNDTNNTNSTVSAVVSPVLDVAKFSAVVLP